MSVKPRTFTPLVEWWANVLRGVRVFYVVCFMRYSPVTKINVYTYTVQMSLTF